MKYCILSCFMQKYIMYYFFISDYFCTFVLEITNYYCMKFSLPNSFSSNKRLVYLAAAGSAAVLAFVGVYVWLKPSSTGYGFTSSKDAIACYRDFYDKLKSQQSTDADGMIASVNKWHEVVDTVGRFLEKDSAFAKATPEGAQFFVLRDSVRNHLSRLCESWRVSFMDIYKIKYHTSPMLGDSTIIKGTREAAPFFEKLDSRTPGAAGKEAALSAYRNFLAESLRRGVSSKEDMLNYLSREDKCFRNFLVNFKDMQGEKVSDITLKTEAVCNKIVRAAQDGKIPTEDALVYLSMRSSRRIIQNAETCLSDISKYDFSSRTQANAYMWIIVQPFVSIDEFSMAALSDKNRAAFEKLAMEIPQSSKFLKAFGINQDALSYLLPQQLLKIYIESLYTSYYN